jgi:hypothetical protein
LTQNVIIELFTKSIILIHKKPHGLDILPENLFFITI